ncbi:hypothetical protein MMC34_004369 [Xylographa carneopallida]|nr:hypothetical protein [Xylographa carneopallida]
MFLVFCCTVIFLPSLQKDLELIQNLQFPSATYPNATSPDPATIAGSVEFQKSPPFYPSPWVSGLGDWGASVAKAQALVAQMTLAEKVNLTTGVGWEGERCVGQTGMSTVIQLNGSEALTAHRFRPQTGYPISMSTGLASDFNSVFSAGVNVAATWDRGRAYTRGQGMGAEHQGKGVDVQLGPVSGPIGRAPEGGRNWEGFSPDPVLSGIMMAQSVQGIQSQGVIACSKHYIGNEQEHFRQVPQAGFDNLTDSYSSNIDDVTLHELYLWPFADAVRAGTGSVMCSYNQVNNSYACQNSYLLNNILKNELGFQGFVVSDWSGQHSGIGSAFAGLDMTMPGDVGFDSDTSFWGTNLTVAVLNGTVPQWRVDDAVTRILAAWYYVGRDTKQIPINFDSWTLATYGYQHFYAQEDVRLINEHVDVRADHAATIRDLGSASTVLLKNVNNALPLTGHEKLTAVFGNDAGDNPNGPNGCSDRGCDNGTLAMGWGSGSANFPYLVTPETAIQNELIGNGAVFESITDNFAYGQIETLAMRASTAIVFVNADAGEGYIVVDGNQGDRNNLTLWQGGDNLIMNVSSLCNNTIVVIHSVGPVLLANYSANPNITAILWAGIPGQESGNSIADVLYGRVNPGAKLPFTMAVSREDYGSDLLYLPNAAVPQLDFAEGVFIDYRALDRAGIAPVYEFGFGLSYTTFAYSALSVVKQNAGPYNPTTGTTAPAPTFGTVDNTSADYLFPSNISRIPFYIYPYLNVSDLQAASQDPAYGVPGYIPALAQDGSPQPLNPAGGAPGGNPQLYDVLYMVTATVTNTGSVAGEEVAQLYLSLGGPYDPPVVLRGFERLSIQPGMSATFTAELTRRDVSNWDTAAQNWLVSAYPKTVRVGSSSRNLPLEMALPM